jgi:hypothetical protein
MSLASLCMLCGSRRWRNEGFSRNQRAMRRRRTGDQRPCKSPSTMASEAVYTHSRFAPVSRLTGVIIDSFQAS